jgi:hypothetical protein
MGSQRVACVCVCVCVVAIQGTSTRAVAGGRSTVKAVPCARTGDVRARTPTSPSPAIPSAPESVVRFHNMNKTPCDKSIITGACGHVTLPIVIIHTKFALSSSFEAMVCRISRAHWPVKDFYNRYTFDKKHSHISSVDTACIHCCCCCCCCCFGRLKTYAWNTEHRPALDESIDAHRFSLGDSSVGCMHGSMC